MTTQAEDQTDPLVRSSWREAIIVTAIWAVTMLWVVGVSTSLGYSSRPDTPKLVLGFPEWVFWGIVTPWITCTVVSIWFGAFFVRDGELGQDLQDTDDLGIGG